MELHVRSIEDVERHEARIRSAAERTQSWIRAHVGDPIELLRAMKFETIGFHPAGDHALNVIEQINQTFTYIVALASVRVLIDRHPKVGMFILAPGATMSRPLDIMSEEPDLVGAETFAAVDPRNNRKLAKDIDKMAKRPERYRYVFFASPLYPGLNRLPKLEREGVEVWSVDA